MVFNELASRVATSWYFRGGGKMFVASCCKLSNNWTFFWNFSEENAWLPSPGFRIRSQDFSGSLKANRHWGRTRSSRSRFFVCFIAPRSYRAEPCTSAELPDATKQTKDYAWQPLARHQRRLAFRNNSCKRLGSCPKRSTKRCLSLLIFSRWPLITHKPDNGTSRPVCWHGYRQPSRIRTTRRLYKIEQMNYENSPQQIELFTQMPELSLNDLKHWADELWKLAKVNTAFHSVFVQMSELSLND